MHIEFYGLTLDTPAVTVHLWTPWRATHIEHRLYEAVKKLPNLAEEKTPDELRLTIQDPKTFRAALQTLARVLKGWQEDADPASERRHWRWLLEGDTDPDGYDHNGEPCSLWAFVQIGLERGGLGDEDKREDVDLNDFGIRIWGIASGQS